MTKALGALALVLLLPALGTDALAGENSATARSKIELFVTSVEESAHFYALLGFEIAQQKADGYTTLKKGSTVIALSPLPSWLPLRWLGFLRYPPIGTEIVLYTERLEELHAVLTRGGYAPGPIKKQSWGDRDFRLTDYEGYYVRVSEGQAIPRPEPTPDVGGSAL